MAYKCDNLFSFTDLQTAPHACCIPFVQAAMKVSVFFFFVELILN